VEDLSDSEGLFAIFDLKHDYTNEWYKSMLPNAAPGTRVMQLGNLLQRLPVYTKTFLAKNIVAKDVYIASSSGVKNTDLTLLSANNALDPFGGAMPVGAGMNLFHISDQTTGMDNWTLQFADTLVEPDEMWMLVRYTLKSN
jgi:hypothetical protein